MIASSFSEIILRDLEKFKEEIRLFPEDHLWTVQGEIKNSAGTLALHLTGNLKHFIGAVLGNTGFVRQRDKEFSDKTISKETLLAGLDETAVIVKKTLSELTDEQVMQIYPLEKFKEASTTLFVLTHLTAHLNYHLGQVNYLRRMN
ncbi:MAG: DinB family protein [Chitinophagales bacterium]|nr:DinB family protein [Chitinophagales bacterium]